MKKKNKINCDVHECKHCDKEEEKCTLDEIKVSKSNDDNEKEDTMCDSFEHEENKMNKEEKQKNKE